MFTIKRSIKLLIDVVNIYFFLLPRFLSSRKLVCIDIYEIGYIQHVIDYLTILEDIPNVEIILTTQDCYLYNQNLLSLNYKIISTRVLRFIFGIHLFITPQVHLKKPPNSYSIHVGHNQPIKLLCFPYNLLKNIDEHFVWGPLMYEWIETMLKDHNLKSKMTKIGSPRHDREIFNNLFLMQTEKDYKNKKKDFVIGYAPSWDEYLSLRTNGIKIIKKIASIKNSVIHLRLHPCSLVERANNDFQYYTGGIYWHEEIDCLKLSNVYFQNQNSTIDYLKNIDILVTDVSSISYDAFALNKPIIFIDTPDFWESLFTSRHVNYSYRKKDFKNLSENKFLNGGRNNGIIVNSVNDLYDYLILFSKSNHIRPTVKKTFLKSLFYNRGESKRFIKQRIIEVLKL